MKNDYEKIGKIILNFKKGIITKKEALEELTNLVSKDVRYCQFHKERNAWDMKNEK